MGLADTNTGRESVDGSWGGGELYSLLVGIGLYAFTGSSGATVQHCKGVTLSMALKLKFVSGLDFVFFFFNLISFIVTKRQFLHTTLRFQVFCLLYLPCHLLIN